MVWALIRVQAPDVADHPGLLRQTEMRAGRLARDLLGLHGGDVDAVVEGLDALARPTRQAGAHVVAHRIGHAEQRQALAEEIGEQLTRAPAVVTEGMVHADHRQLAAEQGDIDGLETVGDADREVARSGDALEVADGGELETTHLATGVVEENHLVGGRTGLDLGTRRTGQIDGADLVGGAGEQRGVLPRAIEEGAVIAMAELQNPALWLAARRQGVVERRLGMLIYHSKLRFLGAARLALR